ncbi:HD domain-containing protein [Actinomadura rubrisoli]|uniref:Uncharacterized protein n=1 Tax=Actinomadura rubrisoli TaxID=2530368 RepID=A0A4R5BFY0_9ACTN|nr:hypothetical protein [Actinomadura rubrisoli]TDD85498.1 hypothetical protein E1298_18535 [Actinomadura rubrisoli]
MGRGQRIDQTNWPQDGPHRRLLELLDRVHRDNGQKSRRDIAAEMHIESASYINDWLRGRRLPVDGRQLEDLVRAMDGGDGDVRAAARLYEEARTAQAEPSAHPWAAQVAGHIAWTLVDAQRDASSFQEATAAIAQRLGTLCSEAEATLDDDPWLDTELAARFTRWTDWLLRTSLAEAMCDLSPAEAALLVLVPLLHHTHLVRTLAGLRAVDPLDLGTGRGDGPRREYETFLGGQREMVDRARARRLPDRDPAATEIGWWLFHRWVARFPQSYRLGAVRELLDAVETPDPRMRDEVLDAKTVQRFLAALRLDLSELGDTDRKNAPQFEIVLFAGEPHEQRVRELLIGQVLTVSYALTLDLVRLPDIVARHLGIPHPVTLPELRATVLDRAKWVLQSDCLVLGAECHHPAELKGLRQYAGQVDALLHTIRQGCGDHSTMQVLTRLPSRASAEGVTPRTDDDGRPIFQRVSRFRLDERRVQDLLMGEQLYQDRGLAVRELYQNALDACRYRRARLAYRSQGDWREDWKGRIRFTQDVDENGRAYLECLDNGIGMTETVLTDVFAQAGTRFTDTTEFLVESADWQSSDPPIPFHANSRFGIGVLSYFMIADEIEVITRPLDRGHRSHPTLKVSIFGPGHLFRIEHLPGDRPPGTSVRLFLREGEKAPSCVEELRRLLGIAEFETRARHGMQEERWEPGVLKPRVQPSWEDDGLNVSGELVPWSDGRGGQVVWCEKGGGLLVDGLHVRPSVRHGVFAGLGDKVLHGVVVNLTGEHAPKQLSVDRRKVLDDVSADVESLLRAAAGELVSVGRELLDVRWLSLVTAAGPRVGDLVAEAAAAAGTAVRNRFEHLDVSRVGCFLQDSYLVMEKDEQLRLPEEGASILWYRDFGSYVPDHVLLWRLIAHGASEELDRIKVDGLPGVLAATPSDALLIGGNRGFISSNEPARVSDWEWQREDFRVHPGHILWIAMLTGTSPRQVARRALSLGYREVDPGCFGAGVDVDRVDLALLSMAANGKPLWWHVGEPVPPRHLAAVALQYGISFPETRRRMSNYGFRVLPEDPATGTLDERDLRLLNRIPDCRNERKTLPLPASHIIQAAGNLGLSVAEVAERMADFGFQVERRALPDRPSAEDIVLFRWSFGRDQGRCDPRSPLPPGFIVQAALELGLDLSEIAARLTGYGIPVAASLPPQVSDKDMALLSRDGDGAPPWWSPDRPIAMSRLLIVSAKAGVPPDRAAARLAEYGLDVPQDGLPEGVDDATPRVLSKVINGNYPWLDPGTLVSRGHLVRASADLGLPPQNVAERLARYGMSLLEEPRPNTDPKDIVLMRQTQNGTTNWLDVDEPVPLLHLLRASRRTGMSVEEAAARLRWLGMDVPDVQESVAEALRRLPRAP